MDGDHGLLIMFSIRSHTAQPLRTPFTHTNATTFSSSPITSSPGPLYSSASAAGARSQWQGQCGHTASAATPVAGTMRPSPGPAQPAAGGA